MIAKGVLRRDLDPEAQSQGYRDAPIGWILEPPRHGPMHLSSQPLGERFARWRRFHRRAAVLLLLTFLGTQVLLLGYHARMLGETSTASITGKDHYVTVDDDDDEVDHWQASSMTRWGEPHVANVEYQGWVDIEAGSEVSIQHLDHSWIQYGSRPTLYVVVALFIVGIAFSALIIYLLAARRARPWYAAQMLDKSSGRLDEDTGLDEHF